ncbi:MAG: recombinase RecA [Candidatus Omnitrophica bacterium]|nr:recombinase RecA [Candidatus Omnitrophota bacterium]
MVETKKAIETEKKGAAETEKKNLELDNKKKALELALSQIEKQFGKGSIMKLDGTVKTDIDAIPTGSLALDLAIGVGGVPRGRVIEIFGPESSGKTTLTLSIIREAQKLGGVAAFIDAEHAFDSGYAKKIGVTLEDLLVSQPDTGEQALEIAETLVRSNAVDLVVIDSVAALTPKAEIEGDMGDSHMGLQARLMSQALRKLTAAINKSRTCVIFINQIRMKIGIMFGNPETTTGGRALKFYASIRIDLRKTDSIKQGENFIGHAVKAKIVKNKVAPPFKEAIFEIYFNEGISRSADILELGVRYNVVEKSGAWFAYEKEKIGQGKDNARKFLMENPKLLEKIEKQIIKAAAEELKANA